MNGYALTYLVLPKLQSGYGYFPSSHAASHVSPPKPALQTQEPSLLQVSVFVGLHGQTILDISIKNK